MFAKLPNIAGHYLHSIVLQILAPADWRAKRQLLSRYPTAGTHPLAGIVVVLPQGKHPLFFACWQVA